MTTLDTTTPTIPAAGPSTEDAGRDDRRLCETCRWWDTSAESVNADPGTTGQCRGAVPIADDRTGLALWPFTEDGDWCRAHEFDVVREPR